MEEQTVNLETQEKTESQAPKSSDSGSDGIAIAALVVGAVNLCAWFIPLAGFPMSVIGIVLGALGLKSEEKKTMAMIGLGLSIVGLILSCGNAILGVMLVSQGYGY